MIDFATLREAVRTWIKTALSLGDTKVILARQPGPRPSLPYVMIDFLTITPVGQGDYSLVADVTGVQTITHQRTMTISVQLFYADGPVFYAEQLVSSLSTLAIRAILHAVGLAYRFNAGISSIPALLDTKFEERALIDFTFGLGAEITDLPGWIEKVEIEGTVEEGDTIVSETFLVDAS